MALKAVSEHFKSFSYESKNVFCEPIEVIFCNISWFLHFKSFHGRVYVRI